MENKKCSKPPTSQKSGKFFIQVSSEKVVHCIWDHLWLSVCARWSRLQGGHSTISRIFAYPKWNDHKLGILHGPIHEPHLFAGCPIVSIHRFTPLYLYSIPPGLFAKSPKYFDDHMMEIPVHKPSKIIYRWYTIIFTTFTAKIYLAAFPISMSSISTLEDPNDSLCPWDNYGLSALQADG